MGHASGKELASKLQSVIWETQILLSLVLWLGSDEPNVNKNAWNIMNQTPSQTWIDLVLWTQGAVISAPVTPLLQVWKGIVMS